MAAFISNKTDITAGRRGAIASVQSQVDQCIMTASCPAGVFVAPDTEGESRFGKLPASAADVAKALGVLVYQSHRSSDEDGNEILEDRIENFLFEGEIWAVCEEAVNADELVYVRHTANGAGKLQLGAVRNDSDGGDVVTFVVNSAVNSETVSLTLDGVTFSYLADSSALVGEIATGLAAKIDAHAAYACPVPGAATFVVTKADGSPIVVTGLSSTITATSGAKAALLPGVKFAKKSSAAGIAKVRLNLPK